MLGAGVGPVVRGLPAAHGDGRADAARVEGDQVVAVEERLVLVEELGQSAHAGHAGAAEVEDERADAPGVRAGGLAADQGDVDRPAVRFPVVEGGLHGGAVVARARGGRRGAAGPAEVLAGGERGGQTGGRVARGELRTRLRISAASVVLEPGADGPDRDEDDHGDDARADREARFAASYRMCVTHRNPRAPAPGRPPRARMPGPVIVRSSNECRVQAASDSTARESAHGGPARTGARTAYGAAGAARPGPRCRAGDWMAYTSPIRSSPRRRCRHSS